MKYKALLVCCGLVSAFSATANAETIGDALAKCSSEQNSLQRLVCYDRVVKDMNQYSGLDEAAKRGYPVPPASSGASKAAVAAVPVAVPETAPATPAPATAATAQPQQAQQGVTFGLESKQAAQQQARMDGTIAKLSHDAYDKYVLTLDNGTVWKQTDNATLKLSEGEAIYIERGMLGAFYLSKEGLNRRIKVSREK